ncbi:Nudix family hydrolase [Orrella marina]|uniref:8-oxo-dGTP diphosphatase n=1 Tax=Orrella marina TaxID=2163011 RepID=A0A2R4XMV3_9BURK|nr:Nudix family hydrolase [Orrella marina]AWB35140.1 Nudix family hydrolase [Orrella marina]
MRETITDVAVGVIRREDGQILIGSRPEGKPWAGWWELPGGKIEPGESVGQALQRELLEEIGIHVTRMRPWVTHVHRYPNTTVRLHFWQVTGWTGQPSSLEKQQLQWTSVQDALNREDLLPATYPPLRWLQIPTRYLISNVGSSSRLPAFINQLQTALAQGITLVQWREPGWQALSGEEPVHAGMLQALALCQAAGARLLVNSVHPSLWWAQSDGVHLRADDAIALATRPTLPDGSWVGVSTHNLVQLAKARELNAEFAVLGPVLETASHPDGTPLGWEQFERLRENAGLPVLAIGGQSSKTLETARLRGAHGIAGIRQIID